MRGPVRRLALVVALGACSSPNEIPEEVTGKARSAFSSNWGLIANINAWPQPMRGTYFFAGSQRDGFNAYQSMDPGAVAANTGGYTVNPVDSGHLFWTNPYTTASQDFAVDEMVRTGVNTVVMSTWGARGTPYWRQYAPMQTSSFALDELFSAVARRATHDIGVMPAIESYPEFRLANDINRYLDALALPRPANGDNSLLGQLEELVNRYLRCPQDPNRPECVCPLYPNPGTNCPGVTTNASWPQVWARMFDSAGQERYAVNLLWSCANVSMSADQFGYALDQLAEKVRLDTTFRLGFTLDPQDHTGDFCHGEFLTTPASVLANHAAVLAIQPYRSETWPCYDDPLCNPHLDRVRALRKRIVTDGWLVTQIPVILDVSPGYDGHIIFGPSADATYGNSDAWRNYQSALTGGGIRGITVNSWNGFTEGQAVMDSQCGAAWNATCPSGDDRVFRWAYDLLHSDPRNCDTWQFVNGVPSLNVYGAICDHWRATEWAGLSNIGTPKTGVYTTLCNATGSRVDFWGNPIPPPNQHDAFSITYSPATGAHTTYGNIGWTYSSGGYDCKVLGNGQYLGLPIGDEGPSYNYWWLPECANGVGRKQEFQHATIDWCPGWATGYAHW